MVFFYLSLFVGGEGSYLNQVVAEAIKHEQ